SSCSLGCRVIGRGSCLVCGLLDCALHSCSWWRSCLLCEPHFPSPRSVLWACSRTASTPGMGWSFCSCAASCPHWLYPCWSPLFPTTASSAHSSADNSSADNSSADNSSADNCLDIRHIPIGRGVRRRPSRNAPDHYKALMLKVAEYGVLGARESLKNGLAPRRATILPSFLWAGERQILRQEPTLRSLILQLCSVYHRT